MLRLPQPGDRRQLAPDLLIHEAEVLLIHDSRELPADLRTPEAELLHLPQPGHRRERSSDLRIPPAEVL